MEIEYIHAYDINGYLIVAESVSEAVEIYNFKYPYHEIEFIKRVKSSYDCNIAIWRKPSQLTESVITE